MDPDDTEEFATGHAAEAGATRRETEAPAILFSIANALQPSGGGYINGRHLAQAVLEAGVRRTVVPHHADET